MKKIIAILALAAMLTACSDKGNAPAETTQVTSAEAVTETTAETTTEATTTSATEVETTAAIEECKCEHEWQHAFAEYINGLDFYYGLYVKDFNNDSIPEVVVARDSCEWTEVLVYNDGEIKSYEYVTAGSHGYVRYIRDTNQILHCPFYGHTVTTQGMKTIFIYDWVDNGFVETFSMERDAAYYEPDILEYAQGYINGEEVDFETFEAKLAEMKQLVEENEYFPCIYKDDENYAEYVAENLPCVKVEECKCEHEWQHAFSEYINGQGNYAGLYIGDINGNETPEAVIAQGKNEMTTVLYYLDGEVRPLDLHVSSGWGYVRYIPETKQILNCPFYGHTWGTFGQENYYIYDWTNKGYVESFSLTREGGYYNDETFFDYGQGYINGEEVDFDTFEAKLAEMKQLVEENEYFPCIYKDDENYAEYVAENLPCVKIGE